MQKRKARGPGRNEQGIAALLLAWYDRERRELPWRSAPGEAADPYRVWLSEIMLQQTTVKAVLPRYEAFLRQWPDVAALASAELGQVLAAWAGLGYYARARNLHACARAVMEEHGGRFPESEHELRKLPGIGAYTASAIAAIAFGERATPIDGNIERVVVRLFAIRTPLPEAKAEIKTRAETVTPSARVGDFAQAMMDLGATICTPKKPACVLCPWMEMCAARARGDQESFPRKAEKKTGALRRGAAFVVVRADGFILLRTRPEKGLLGGMTEVPTTAWTSDFDAAELGGAPLKANWRRVPGTVTHTFTHFPLALTVYTVRVPKSTAASKGTRWVRVDDLANEALPSVMRKVVFHVLKK